MTEAHKLKNRSSDSEAPWALKLFNKSPLKQQKLAAISNYLGDLSGKECLDIGSDNGVVSLLLRDLGGNWSSADLIPETVESIRSLVGERVFQIGEKDTPFEDAQFDLVVIVDYLEHIETDAEFVKDLYRILKPGGTLIANVPNPKNGILRAIKHAIGQTDEAHGHVRPGYSLDDLKNLFGDMFEIQESRSYVRLFSELVDTLITFALDILKGSRSKKGTVVTGNDMSKLKKSFKMFSLIYPFLKLAVLMDKLIPFLHGNMLIVKAKSK